MNDIELLIEATTTKILDDWTAEAIASSADVDSYIGDKLEALENTDAEVSIAVGKAYLKRLGFTA